MGLSLKLTLNDIDIYNSYNQKSTTRQNLLSWWLGVFFTDQIITLFREVLNQLQFNTKLNNTRITATCTHNPWGSNSYNRFMCYMWHTIYDYVLQTSVKIRTDVTYTRFPTISDNTITSWDGVKTGNQFF